jgi:small subunit ribosomal protein S17
MRRTLIGIVTGDRRAKTRRVEVARQFRHPKYGKIVRDRTVCHVHDENETSKAGDQVEIVECRPHSRMKRWELVRVVKAATKMEVAAAAADASAAKAEESSEST